MMNFFSTISILASLIYIYVGVNTYKLNKKSKECRVFLILNISMAIWSFAYSFAYVAENSVEFSFWNKISAIGWCTFPALILYLVLTITNSRLLKYLLIKIFVLLPAFIFLFMSVFLFGPSINTHPYVSSFFYNSNFIYNFSFLLLSILLIYIWGKKSEDSSQKKQSNIIVVSSIIPFLLNLTTQSILPMLGLLALPLMGQIYSLIMLWGVYYAIKSYQFMQIPSSQITNVLFNEIMDITFLIDLKGNIIRSNNKVHDLLEYTEHELNLFPITNIIMEDTFINLIDKCNLISEPIKLNNIIISSKTGTQIPFDITVSPLIDLKRKILLGILIIGQDVRFIMNLQTEIASHKKTSEKLIKSEELFRTMIEMLPYAIALTGIKDDKIIYVNNKMEELFDLKSSSVIGEPAGDFYQNREDRINIMQQLKEGMVVKEQEIDFKKTDNTIISGLLTVVNTLYNDQEVILSCISDITEQRKLQHNIVKSEEMLKKLMNSIPDLVTVTDLEGNINFLNQSITILGYNPNDILVPKNFLSIISENDLAKAKFNMDKMFFSDLGPVEYTQIKKDGSLVAVEVNGTVLRDNDEKPFGMIFVTRDITDRKKVQEEFKKSKEEIEKINLELLKTNLLLHERSIRDSLTNLYNHQHINELLDIEIQTINNSSSNLCLMMLDIDFFKRVNDNYGHQVGDHILVTLSQLIIKNVRSIDLVGRYGGEEFIVILPNASLDEAYEIAEKIRFSIQSFHFGLENHKITMSIGLTQYQMENAKSFIKRADTLLYLAKENGRNKIQV